MRVRKNVKADSDGTVVIKKDRHRKINWPDLMFGPVNLWTLPPASFFYRK
jgi:hypothetical protein